MRKYILFVGLILFFNSFLFAQEKDDKLKLKSGGVMQPMASDTLVLSNHFISVMMEETYGTFSIRTVEKNLRLLYPIPDPGTPCSYANFRINGINYTTSPRMSITRITPNSVWKDMDKINVLFREQNGIEIRQELIPRENLEKRTGAVLIRYVFKNNSNVTQKVGAVLKLDTYLGYFEYEERDGVCCYLAARGNDQARIALPSGFINWRTIVRPIPDYWLAFEDEQDVNALIARGTLRGRDLVCPDLLYVGNAVLGGYSINDMVGFDETSMTEGGGYTDSGILMRWDERDIAPGETIYVATLYGMGDAYEEGDWLNCPTLTFEEDTVDTYNVLIGDNDDYEMNPFDYVVPVRNPSLTVDNVSATIQFDSTIFELVPLSASLSCYIGTLVGSEQADPPPSWKIRIKDQCAGKERVPIKVIITDGYSVLDSCTKFFNIPANRLHSLNLLAEPANAGTVSPGSGKYECDVPITITATPHSGFKFLRWEGNFSGSDTENPKTLFLDIDKNIRAIFLADSFSLDIKVDPIGAGSTTPSVGVHRYRNGDVADISYTPDPCYTFVGWSGDTTSINDRLSVTMYKDMNITAEFARKVFTVNDQVVVGIGSIDKTPSSINGGYYCGDSITISAISDACYDFEKWEIKMDGFPDTTITQNPVKSPIFGDVSVKAYFAIKEFTLTTSANINVAVDTIIISPRKNEYDCGDMVTLTVVPDSCYNFSHWEDDPTNTNPVRVVTIQRSVDYMAVLDIKRVTIKTSTDFPNSGTTTTIPPIDTCDCGSTVQLNVTPDCLYDFVKWSDGNINRTRDITIKSDTNITANMARISLNVTKSEPNIFPNIVVNFQIDSTWYRNDEGWQSSYFNRSQFTVIDEDSIGNSKEITNFNLVGNQIVYSLYGNCYDEYTDLKRRTIVKFVRHGCTYIDTARYTIDLNAGCDSCSRLLQRKKTPNALWQNRPNPYNPETRIGYSIAESDHVFIVVYDILGREVAVLVNDYKEAGEHEIIFKPHGLPSGIYLYKMKTSTFQAVKKMSFVK